MGTSPHHQGSKQHHHHRARHPAAFDNVQHIPEANEADDLHSWLNASFPEEHDVKARESLTKRADIANLRQIFYEARCKGERYLRGIRDAETTDSGPLFSSWIMESNGWVMTPLPAGDLGTQVQIAMSRLGIPATPDRTHDISADLRNDFHNRDDELEHPLGGVYFNRYIVADNPPPQDPTALKGTIVGINNFGQTFFARQTLGNDEAAIKAALPPYHNWADVVWAVWTETAGNRAGNLRYIFHENIDTESTKHLMEMAEGVFEDEVTGRLRMPWPGHTYRMDDPSGLALLGSAHGVGTAWLYIRGRAALGSRRDFTVTVFTSQVPGFAQPNDGYYLLWDLGPRLGP